MYRENRTQNIVEPFFFRLQAIWNPLMAIMVLEFLLNFRRKWLCWGKILQSVEPILHPNEGGECANIQWSDTMPEKISLGLGALLNGRILCLHNHSFFTAENQLIHQLACVISNLYRPLLKERAARSVPYDFVWWVRWRVSLFKSLLFMQASRILVYDGYWILVDVSNIG